MSAGRAALRWAALMMSHLRLSHFPCVLRHRCFCRRNQAGCAEPVVPLDLALNRELGIQRHADAVPYCCRIVRNILADKPRVTKFPIEFDGPAEGEALPVAGDMSESQQQQVGSCVCSEALLMCALSRRRNNAWKCNHAVACVVAFSVLTWPLEPASAALASCA